MFVRHRKWIYRRWYILKLFIFIFLLSWVILLHTFADNLRDFSTNIYEDIDQPFIVTTNGVERIEPNHPISSISCPNNFDCPSLTIPLVITLCIDKSAEPNEIDTERKRGLDRQEEQIRTMFASLLLFSREPVWRIIVVTDTEETFQKVVNLISNWPRNKRRRLILERRQISIPDHPFFKKWRPCCWAKMFLDDMMPDLDFVVYIDTDFLFVGPAEDIWHQIPSLRDSDAIVAYAPEPWYKHENFTRKTAGTMGINTGIALQNLTRTRYIGYGKLLLQEINRTISPRHDQDVANSFLANHPSLLHELSSRFNFNPAICTEDVPCADCKTKGIVALHGSDASFYKLVDLRIQTTFALLNEISRTFSETPLRIFKMLTTQLHLVQTSRRRLTACRNYSGFSEMVLHSFRDKIQFKITQ